MALRRQALVDLTGPLDTDFIPTRIPIRIATPSMHLDPITMTAKILRFALAAGCLLVGVSESLAQAPSEVVEAAPVRTPATARNRPDPCGCQNLPGGFPCTGPCQSCLMGVDCTTCGGAEERWRDMRPMPFGAYGQGGYAGPARLAHLSEYRLRPGDQLQVIYLITRRQNDGPYRLAPGDTLLIESVADTELNRGTLENGLEIQPDGSISLRLLGQVHASGLTVTQLRELLNKEYSRYYEEPSIDVTPVKTNRLAEDIRNAVGGQNGFNEQAITVVVMPSGKIRLPGLGEVCVQGFTLNQLKRELELRYDEVVVGLDIEPLLAQQAPHFVHVLGAVATPNRIELTTPTTVLGAIAAAGGHAQTANLRQVVILRRAEDWRLISTMLDLQGAVYGKRPTPADEIWVRDGDVIIVPVRPIVRLNTWIQQVFTDGIYAAYPAQFQLGGNNN